MLKRLVLILAALMVSVASAVTIPNASAKALGVTKGKPCATGVVFVNGKYLEAPYTVERWGAGIRINGTPVIAQVVSWNEFLKTQPNVKITKTEAPAGGDEASEDEEDDEPEDLDDEDEDDSLDDLFDDDPKPAKKAVKKAAPKKKSVKKAAKKPSAKVSYTLEGDFVANDKSKALVARVNKKRAEINTRLLSGGVYFFGDKYAAVAADARTAEQVLKALPEILKKSTSAADLINSVRGAGLVYLTRPICLDLFGNKRDYIRIQQRRDKMLKDQQFKNLMNGSGSSPLL